MNNTKNYSEHLAKLNALRDEILGIKRDPTAEERKIEAEYAVAFKDMLHTGMPQNALKMGSDGSGGFLVPDTFEKKLVQGLTNENLLRRLGTVLKTTKTMKIPRVVEEGSASWIPEGEIYHHYERKKVKLEKRFEREQARIAERQSDNQEIIS